MRVCIYKTDNAPDLTLFLQEGLALPSEARDQNWVQLKTITKGELSAGLAMKMEKTGCCVERLGRLALSNAPASASARSKRVLLRWLGFAKPMRS